MSRFGKFSITTGIAMLSLAAIFLGGAATADASCGGGNNAMPSFNQGMNMGPMPMMGGFNGMPPAGPAAMQIPQMPMPGMGMMNSNCQGGGCQGGCQNGMGCSNCQQGQADMFGFGQGGQPAGFGSQGCGGQF